MKFSETLHILRRSLKRGSLKNLFLSYLNLKLEPEAMSSIPLIVQIEPTVHCNLKCRMCANPISERAKRHMKLGEFKDIVDQMPGLQKISLVGAGEPLMNPDLFDMINYAKSKGILIGFATNGTLLTEDVSKKIIASGADWVNISLDSSDKAEYEGIREGASFDAVTENVKRMVRIKDGAPYPELSLWFVLMKDNACSLPGVIKLAKELGIDKVSAQLEHSWNEDMLKDKISKRNAGGFIKELNAVLKNAKDTAKEAGVKFDYVNVPSSGGKRACKWPWKSCYITVEGFVTPCCLHGSNPDKINFGNVFKENFASVWNSGSYKRFRASLKSGIPPGICVGCTAYFDKMKI